MALVKRGDPSFLLQADWEVTESEDNSMRATLMYKGDRANIKNAPRIRDRIFTGEPLFCFERRRIYNRLRCATVQCDFIGIERDPTPFRIEFPGGSGTEPIESHPNFSLLAGTAENPRPGAVFNEDGTFAGFTSGTKKGITSYIVPDVRVNINYWTFRVPNAKRITKEIAYSLPGVAANPTVLNYLLIGLVYRQFGVLYQVTEQWLGSGPLGWNREIY
jgi:hypothetical protein